MQVFYLKTKRAFAKRYYDGEIMVRCQRRIMQKIAKIFLRILLGMVMLLWFIGVEETNAAEFNFSVIPTIPENQIDKSKTYFELKMAPGAEQVLTLLLRNDTDKEVVVEADINPTSTNINGVVEYSNNESVPDPTLLHNLKELSEINKEIVLAPQSEQQVEVKVRMPKEELFGIISGGITFKEKEGEDTSQDKKETKGLSIANKYAYVIAMVLRQNEEPVFPDLVLSQVQANQVNYRNVINANLQNPNSAYLNQLAIKADVKLKGQTEVLYSLKQEMMQVAPNSNFDWPIPLEGKKLKAGNYILTMEAYGVKSATGEYSNGQDEEGQPIRYKYRWEFEKEFEIKPDQAKKFNQADVSIPEEKNWLWLIIGLLLLLVVVLVLILIYKSKKTKRAKASQKGRPRNPQNSRPRKGAPSPKENREPRPKPSQGSRKKVANKNEGQKNNTKSREVKPRGENRVKRERR